MNEFSKLIEKWYFVNKRELPWRDTRDPYKIWISEIILQQTRVDQGKSYYLRFINRFPDIRSLAQADEQEVLLLWQGLGYYSRARNMHKAAQQLMQKGGFSPSYEDMLELQGIGAYTAAAICSFAFDMPIAVLDGNVFRVLSRYMAIDMAIDSSNGKKYFGRLSQDMLDKDNPALYNSAIMDFGALLCTPQNPHCSLCPLMYKCKALKEGKVSCYPVKLHKLKTKDCFFTYLYIKNKDEIVLHKRSKIGIWRNMYELPCIESLSFKDQDLIFEKNGLKRWKQLLNEDLTISKEINQLKHQLTHRTIYADCYTIDITNVGDKLKKIINKTLKLNHCFWVKSLDVVNYPFPSLVSGIIKNVCKPKR